MTFPDLAKYHAPTTEEPDWTTPLCRDDEHSLPFDFPYAADQGPEAPFTKRLEHWIKALRGEEKLNCTLRDGIMCVRLLELVLESAESGKAVEVDGLELEL